MAADPTLLRAWLVARSVARRLPEPVDDFGGLRVDTNSEKEVCRWVFADAVEAIGRLAETLHEPRQLIKLCGTADDLAAVLPRSWTVEGGRWFMALDANLEALGPIPTAYRLEQSQEGAVTKVVIRTDGGEVAASGFAAETADAFVYDRIETDVRHRRRGLARAVMEALGSCRQSPSARQLLVATAEGERLYSSLGWRRLSAYSTASLPEM